MNKIFKIVWNHNIGSYTVVSELAKGKTKASSEQNNSISEAGKGRLKKQFILTALALSLGVESAWAMIPEGNASGAAAIAVGTDSKATTTQSIAIGWTAQATGATQAVAIGPDAIASGTQSTSIGNNTRATGDSSIAIGGDDWNIVRTKPVAAAGNKQVHQVFQELTGMEMKANGEAYKNPFKGTTSADAAVAVGVNAYAEGVLSTAFGSGTSATGLGASAFGVGASASKDKSVAIGAGSNTSMDAAAITTATVNGITYNGFAGATKITAGSQVSVGRPGYERQIKHVAPGEISATSTDAINGSQLYQVAAQAANPLKFDGDRGTTVERKLGSTLNVKGGATGTLTDNNIGVVADKSSNTLRLKLAQNVNLGDAGSLRTGDTIVNNDGVAITGGPSITKTGISAGNKPITNVASGGTTDSNAANIGDVKKAAAAAKTVVKQGANTTVSSATDAATGATEYTVNAEKSVVQGSSDVTVNAVTNGLTTTYTADLSTTAKASLAKADSAVQKVVSSNPNLTASKTGDTVTLDFSQTPSFTSVTTGNSVLTSDGLKIGSGTNSVSLTNTGLSNGGNKITNIADGAADTDAASFKQVKAAKTEVQAGTNVASVTKTDSPTDGHAVYTVNAKGATVALDSSVDGLKLTSSEDSTTNVTTYNLDLSDKTKTSLAKADSALQNIGVQVNGTDAKTLNQANSMLNFVNGAGTTAENKNGNIAFNVNKANLSVNGGTVSADKNGDEFATAKSVADAINQAVTGSEKTSVVAAGDNTHVASAVSGNQTTYTVHADKTTVSAKTGGKLALNSTEVTNGNQTKTTNYELDLTDDAKAEIAKGVDAKTAVDTKGIGFAADSGSPVTKKLGDSLNIKGDNKNITTKINNGDVQVTLNDDISVQNVNASASVITPKVVAGDSTLTSDGLNITGGPSITKTGISAGNKPITNVASGGTTDSNAANIGDVKKAAAAAKTVVKQGANTTVSSATDAATGATEYTVNAEKSVVQGSSDVTVNAVTNGLTTTYTADLSTTAKASLAKADSAVQKVVSSNPNLTASKTGDTVTLDFSQTPSFTSVTTGNSVLTSDGLKIGSGTNSVSLTNTGLSNGGNKITNIADGAADTDAASFKQVKAAKTEVQAGTNVASVTKTDSPTDGHAVYTVNAKGATVALDSSVDGLKLTSSEDSTTNVTTYNLDLSDKTKTSLAKADSALQNIGVQVNGTDAKTLNQANSMLNFVNGAGTTAENKNGNIAFNVNKANLSVNGGTVSADKNGDEFATAKSVADAINQAVTGSEKTSVVAAGDNTHVASAVSGNQTTYTVHADKTTVSAKTGGKLALNSTEVTNGNQTKTTNYELDLTDDAKAEIAKGVDAKTAVDTKGIGFAADSGSPVTKKLGDSLNIKGDNKNITTKINNGDVQVTLNDDISVQNVNASASVITPKVVAGDSTLTSDGLNITGGPSITKTGISAGNKPITNVASGGTIDSNAANIGDVKQAAAAAKTEVQAGTNVASVIKTDGTNGQAIYTVNAKAAAVALDSSVDGLKLTSSEDTTTNVTTYKLDLADKTKTSLAKADSALQNIGVQVNGTTAKTLNQANSTLNFVNGTGTTAENKNGDIAFNVNKANLSVNGGTVSADKNGDEFATAKSVADAINQAVTGSEKTSVVAAGDNTHVASAVSGNQTTYTVHADKTTVSAKTGGKLTVTSAQTANGNQTKTTNYELDLTDDTKAEIAKGVEAKTAVDTKGIGFAADSGSPVTKKLGDSLNIKGDNKNIETVAGSSGINVKLKDQITVKTAKADTFKAGDSTLNSDGLKINNGANPVELTKAGLNNGGNKITNVAKGTADTDGVNVSQLNPVAKALNTNIDPTTGEVAAPTFTVTKADGTKHPAVGTVQEALDKVGEEVSKGLNIVADNGSSEKVNLGDTVTYTSKDKNIVTTSGTGKAIDFSLAEKVTIGKDAANGGKPVVIDGKEGIVSGLTNQALGGADFATKGQAATEEQLNETQANLAKLLGGNAANNNGNVTTNNIGGTGKDNVHEAIAAVKETADKGWNLKANDETESEKIAAGDTVTVKQGKNIRVKRSGKELMIETSDDVEFGTVSATTVLADSFISGNSVLSGEGLKIGADGSPSQVSLTNAGLNNGGNKIANVAKGTDDTDAVNVAQLNEQLAATEKTTTVVAGKNVTVSEKVDGNNTEYTVNADKTTLSQAANGAVKVSEGAKDADGVTDYALDLTDEAKADIAKGVAAKDAVDNKGLTFAADNGTTGAKKLGDSLSVKGDGNILTRADENGIGFSLADKITVGKAGNGNKPLVIDGTAGLISGLSNTTLGGADFATKGQAASEEQLNAAQANLANLLGGNAANDKGNVTTTDIGGTGKDNVHDAIAAVKETADKGWNLNANDETSSEKIGAGDTVTFKEGKNVKVSRNGKNITVATSDDVSFDKVTVGGSVLTDNGLTVGNGKAGKPVSLTKDGLNNGGNKVSNIAAGEADTDAVNVAQLKAAAAKATSKVDSGNDNIVVTPKQNADGSTTYTVATAPNLKADSFTAGDTVVNNDGVKVGDKVALGKDGLKAGDVNITADGINAGNKAISNVAEGKKDTDAVNVGQLNRLTAAAKTEVEAGTNIASVSSKQGANGQTVYTVNADGASVSAGSDNIVVTKGNKDANNVTDYAVDLSKAVKADIAKGVAAKDAVDNKGISFAGDSGTTVANKLGDTVAVKGDANITTTAGANGIQVGLNKDLKVDSVKAGDTVVNNNGVNVGYKVALSKDGLKAGDVNITAEGINAGGKKVTGVAAGTVAAGSTDAVNGGQLHQMYELIGSNGGNVNTAPPSVEADGKAGLGNIKNITLVDNSNNPNVTNVTNETKIAQSNGYSLVTYNVEDQGMYVTNNVIEAVGRMNEQGIKFFHTNDGKVEPDVQAYNGEDSSASGAYATAVGYQAASKGTNAIAIGKGAQANAENAIAIGTGNIVSGKNSGAIGDPTVVSGNSAYSIGNNNNVSADNAYALGSDIKATVKDSVYLGDRAQTQGIRTADATKGEAYTYGGLNDKAVAGKAGSTAAANKVAGVVTVGNGTDETRQVQGVAAGVVSADSTDAINGSQLYYTNQAIANVATQATAAKTEVTAGKNVVVNQTPGNSGQTVYNVATADKLDVTSVTAGGVTINAQGVSIAAPTAHNPANTVSLSPIGLNNGGQRITNVAPAKEGTDAVNLNQLAGMGNALQNNIDRVGKKAYSGVAGAIAQGSIPQVTRPGATGIGVGSGYYGGQSAMAIGVSAMSDGGNWIIKGNFSANTGGHVGVGAGALYQW